MIRATSRSYAEFRERLEGVPHSLPHNNIGGDLVNMLSPYDPIFWLHHVNLDRQWNAWQLMRPEFLSNYGGMSRFPNALLRQASSNDIIYPWNIATFKVFNTEDMCFKYGPLYNDPQIDQGSNVFRRSLPMTVPAVITATPKTATDHNTPADDDRKELIKIRKPSPIPDAWIKMNSLDKDKIREQEANIFAFIRKLNIVPDYISDAALWHKKMMLSELMQKVRVRNEHLHLHADLGDKSVTIAVKPEDIPHMEVPAWLEKLKAKIRQKAGKGIIVRGPHPEVQKLIAGGIAKN